MGSNANPNSAPVVDAEVLAEQMYRGTFFPPDDGDCWPYVGGQGHHPSAQRARVWAGSLVDGPRAAVFLETGRWPTSRQPRLNCGTRNCVNPAHVEQGREHRTTV